MVKWCISNWIDITLENPFKTWWKARKYFKFPKIVPFIGSIRHYCPFTYYGNVAKILDIRFLDLLWKDKWNSPRHEESPYIWFCLFKRFVFGIQLNVYTKNEFGEKELKDMYYWEYLLNYLYYTHSLKLADIWCTYSKIFKTSDLNYTDKYIDSLKVPIYTHLFSLNKRGLKEFKKLYDE